MGVEAMVCVDVRLCAAEMFCEDAASRAMVYSAVRKVLGQMAKHTKYATFWGAPTQERLIALQFSEI